MELLERYNTVRGRIEEAARKAGRDPKEVRLIAVSKLHPVASIAALAEAGHRDFAENYIQEALGKQKELGPELRWHFIGHLQTNKAKFLPGNFHMLHSLGSSRLARALHSKARTNKTKLPVLIQVNLARETQKSGIVEEDLPELAELVLSLSELELQGLMIMPPYSEQGEDSRPYFAKLRTIRDRLETQFGKQLPHLSMGMSNDFTQAIEEGATLVRVGTDIFGQRA